MTSFGASMTLSMIIERYWKPVVAFVSQVIDIFRISIKSSDSSDSSKSIGSSDSSKSSDSSESSESSKSSKASASVGRLSSYSFKNYFLRFPKLQI